MRIFSTDGFVRYQDCGDWPTALRWLHNASDLSIALAYAVIPAALLYFYLRQARRSMPMGLLLFFAAFIVMCGWTHANTVLMAVWPAYWYQGLIKAATGLISLGTAAALLHLLPKLLAYRDPSESADLLSRLDRSDRIYSALINSFPLPVIGISEDQLVIRWNKAAEVVFGWKYSEAIGKSPEDLIIPRRYHKLHRDAVRRYLATKVPKTLGQKMTLEAVTRHGLELPVEIFAFAVPENGHVQFNAIIRDMTEQNRIERHQSRTIQTITEECIRLQKIVDSSLTKTQHDMDLGAVIDALEKLKEEP